MNSVRSGYWLAMKKYCTGQSSDNARMSCWWNKQWHLRIPNKVKLCVLKAFQDILPLMDALRRRGINAEIRCFRCHNTAETLVHALLDCLAVQEVREKTSFAEEVYKHHQINMASILSAVSERYAGEDLEVFCIIMWAV